MRSLVLEHPEEPEYRDLFDQYLLGPDIMVAPVWQEGITERQVRIPPGDWRDAWTGDVVAAGSVVTVPAPEHRMPIYVRAGSEAAALVGDLEARWAAAQAATATPPDLGALATGVE